MSLCWCDILNPVFGLAVLVYLMSMVLVMGVEDWFVVWLGLEVNMMSFLFLVYSSDVNVGEAMGSYFFVQSLGSGCLIGLVNLGWVEVLWGMVLMLKMGVGVFFYWYVSVMRVISWAGVYLLSVFQSIVPLMLMKDVMSVGVLLMGLVGSVMGVIGSYSQVMLKLLVGYSSVYHYGWMIVVMVGGEWAWVVYVVIYGLVMFQVVVEMDSAGEELLVGISMLSSRVSVVVGLLGLAGFPPLLGFFLKWAAFTIMLRVDFLILMVFVVLSVVMMYVYLRLLYSVLLGGVRVQGWELGYLGGIVVSDWLVVGGVVILVLMMVL